MVTIADGLAACLANRQWRQLACFAVAVATSTFGSGATGHFSSKVELEIQIVAPTTTEWLSGLLWLLRAVPKPQKFWLSLISTNHLL
jgi:hypothetical protein